MLANSPRKRFDRLVELAEQGPESRELLLGELRALLEDWPADYPEAMRYAFAALLDNAARDTAPPGRAVDGPTLVHAARTMNGAFVEVLASALALDADETRSLLSDASGDALARACRKAHLDRACYSAIVVLAAKGGDIVERLKAYDRAL
jgi:hypothetical protein